MGRFSLFLGVASLMAFSVVAGEGSDSVRKSYEETWRECASSLSDLIRNADPHNPPRLANLPTADTFRKGLMPDRVLALSDADQKAAIHTIIVLALEAKSEVDAEEFLNFFPTLVERKLASQGPAPPLPLKKEIEGRQNAFLGEILDGLFKGMHPGKGPTTVVSIRIFSRLLRAENLPFSDEAFYRDRLNFFMRLQALLKGSRDEAVLLESLTALHDFRAEILISAELRKMIVPALYDLHLRVTHQDPHNFSLLDTIEETLEGLLDSPHGRDFEKIDNALALLIDSRSSFPVRRLALLDVESYMRTSLVIGGGFYAHFIYTLDAILKNPPEGDFSNSEPFLEDLKVLRHDMALMQNVGHRRARNMVANLYSYRVGVVEKLNAAHENFQGPPSRKESREREHKIHSELTLPISQIISVVTSGLYFPEYSVESAKLLKRMIEEIPEFRYEVRNYFTNWLKDMDAAIANYMRDVGSDADWAGRIQSLKQARDILLELYPRIVLEKARFVLWHIVNYDLGENREARSAIDDMLTDLNDKDVTELKWLLTPEEARRFALAMKQKIRAFYQEDENRVASSPNPNPFISSLHLPGDPPLKIFLASSFSVPVEDPYLLAFLSLYKKYLNFAWNEGSLIEQHLLAEINRACEQK